MNCPKCGVDIDFYLKQEAERKRRIEREKEFEKTFGGQFRPIRQKRAMVYAIIGGLTGLILTSCIFSAVILAVFGTFGRFWELSKNIPPHGFLLAVIAFLFPTAFSAYLHFCFGKYAWGKQEKELRRNFNF